MEDVVTLRRHRRRDSAAYGAYLWFGFAAVLSFMTAAIMSIPGWGVVAPEVMTALIGLLLLGLIVQGARCKVEVCGDQMRVVNPFRTWVLDRTRIQWVALKRLNGQTYGLRLILWDGRKITIVGLGPDELDKFCEVSRIPFSVSDSRV